MDIDPVPDVMIVAAVLALLLRFPAFRGGLPDEGDGTGAGAGAGGNTDSSASSSSSIPPSENVKGSGGNSSMLSDRLGTSG